MALLVVAVVVLLAALALVQLLALRALVARAAAATSPPAPEAIASAACVLPGNAVRAYAVVVDGDATEAYALGDADRDAVVVRQWAGTVRASVGYALPGGDAVAAATVSFRDTGVAFVTRGAAFLDDVAAGRCSFVVAGGTTFFVAVPDAAWAARIASDAPRQRVARLREARAVVAFASLHPANVLGLPPGARVVASGLASDAVRSRRFREVVGRGAERAVTLLGHGR